MIRKIKFTKISLWKAEACYSKQLQPAQVHKAVVPNKFEINILIFYFRDKKKEKKNWGTLFLVNILCSCHQEMGQRSNPTTGPTSYEPIDQSLFVTHPAFFFLFGNHEVLFKKRNKKHVFTILEKRSFSFFHLIFSIEYREIQASLLGVLLNQSCKHF